MLAERRTSTVLELPREVVFAALTDYGSYARWMPEMSHSLVLARDGDLVVAEFLWPVCLHGKFVLEFMESRPESVVYTQTGQLRKWGLTGRWDLAATPSGQGTILNGTMKIDTDFWDRWANRRKADRALHLFQEAISKRALAIASQAASLGEPGTRRKILEVVRKSGGLDVWLLGESYRLEKKQGGRA